MPKRDLKKNHKGQERSRKKNFREVSRGIHPVGDGVRRELEGWSEGDNVREGRRVSAKNGDKRVGVTATPNRVAVIAMLWGG